MKRCGPWLLVGFVLALLLTLGPCADRPTRVFLNSPIGRASYLVSRLLVPAVAVMVPAVQSAKFCLPPEARRSRAGPDECLPVLANFSLNHAPLRADDTGPPWIDLCGPPVLVRTAPTAEVARPAGPAGGPPKGGIYPSETAKTGVRKNRGSATCNFYDRL